MPSLTLDPDTSPDAGDSVEQGFHLLQRETFLLLLLVAAAVALYFVTRAIAANNRGFTLREAAEWYARGQQQIAAGDADRAVDSFRRATAKNRDEPRYVLALTGALVHTGRGEEARAALLAEREKAPEDVNVNLQLARLAAGRLDETEAARFYRNALYAPWPADQADTRRSVRLELIHFLLAQNDATRAMSEIVALSADLPGDPASQVQAGQLFAQAGDNPRALEHFERALRQSPDNGSALAGAGLAAFRIGDDALALQYLRLAPDGGDVESTRTLAELIQSNDPLAARIGPAARRRRLLDGLSYVRGRLTECTGQPGGAHAVSPDLSLLDEGDALEAELARTPGVGQDTIESGLDLLSRAEMALTAECPPATPLDRALTIIGQHHGADRQ